MRLTSLAVLGFPAAAVPATAGDQGPVIPKPAESEHCIRDNDTMRGYHMTMAYQQRDAVVHSGDRSGEFSIGRCVTRHAVPGADGKPVSYADPRHFCRACHDYEAVSIDCFDCRRSTPLTPSKAVANDLDRAYATATGYLGSAVDYPPDRGRRADASRLSRGGCAGISPRLAALHQGMPDRGLFQARRWRRTG